MCEVVSAVVEVSPHPVLTLAAQETVESSGAGSVAVFGSLRRDDGGLDRFVASMARAFVHGVEVDWGVVLDRGAGARV